MSRDIETLVSQLGSLEVAETGSSPADIVRRKMGWTTALFSEELQELLQEMIAADNHVFVFKKRNFIQEMPEIILGYLQKRKTPLDPCSVLVAIWNAFPHVKLDEKGGITAVKSTSYCRLPLDKGDLRRLFKGPAGFSKEIATMMDAEFVVLHMTESWGWTVMSSSRQSPAFCFLHRRGEKEKLVTIIPASNEAVTVPGNFEDMQPVARVRTFSGGETHFVDGRKGPGPAPPARMATGCLFVFICYGPDYIFGGHALYKQSSVFPAGGYSPVYSTGGLDCLYVHREEKN